MDLNFLKTRFSNVFDWFDDVAYRVEDHFDNKKFISAGLPLPDQNNFSLTYFKDLQLVREKFKQDHKIKNKLFETICFVLNCPLYVRQFYQTFLSWLFPEDILKISLRLKRRDKDYYNSNYYAPPCYTILHFNFKLLEEFVRRQDFLNDYNDYKERNQEAYERIFVLYQWWQVRKQFEEPEDETTEQWKERAKEDRRRLLELIEVSDFLY